MQDCFRLHPEIYGSELDEEEVDEQLTEQIAQRDRQDQAAQQSEPQQQEQVYTNDPASASLNQAEKQAEIEEIHKANEHSQQAAQEEENLVPRAWHESEADGKTTEK